MNKKEKMNKKDRTAMKLKLFVWEWSKDHSWERVTVLAPDVKTARELVKQDGSFMHPGILKAAPEIHDKPVVLYDVE